MKASSQHPRQFLRLALFAALALGLTTKASLHAATYYVTTTGVDSSSRTGLNATDQAWLTVAYAANTRVLSAGNTISVGAGTFNETGVINLANGVNLVGAGHASTTVNNTSASISPNIQFVLVKPGTAPSQTISGIKFEFTNLANTAVLIWGATTNALTITDCHLIGQGGGVASDTAYSRIRVTYCKGEGRFSTVAGKQQGDFVSVRAYGGITGPASLKVDHCTVTGTMGIKAWSYSGNQTTEKFEITNNKITNSDGRKSAAGGGPDNNAPVGAKTSVIGFYRSKNLPGSKIERNEIINHLNQSAVCDGITTYLSGGKLNDPVSLSANYIQGGYGFPNENTSPTQILLGDGNPGESGNGNYNPTYIRAHYNSIVSGNGVGIGLTVGSNMDLYRNRVFRSGYFWNSTTNNPKSGPGLQIWNIGKMGSAAYTGMTPMTNITVRWNDVRAVGYNFDGSGQYKRFDIDTKFEDSDTAISYSDNNSLRLPNATFHSLPTPSFWTATTSTSGYHGYWRYFTMDTVGTFTTAAEMGENQWWWTNIMLQGQAGAHTVGCGW